MNSSAVLNPTTPLAYLPPELATLHQITGYIYVTSLGVCEILHLFSHYLSESTTLTFLFYSGITVGLADVYARRVPDVIYGRKI